jgi:nicotinate-nucleotide--dimethylbenzimidazole phosphoribosyltransferase
MNTLDATGSGQEATIDWLEMMPATPDADALRAAEQRQEELIKPRGALGRLEEIAIRLAAMQGTDQPHLDKVRIVVCAGDHGVVAEKVSVFPQLTTVRLVEAFSRGGAAINVAADSIGASLEVINLGTVQDPEPREGLRDYRLGPGTANMVEGPAMTAHQLALALAAGRHAAERARLDGVDLFIGGEMGIGNTTAATAVACALLGLPAAEVAGRGAGLDGAGLAHKIAVIERALALHASQPLGPVEALRRLGGFEIAALTGAYVACAHLGVPVLVDGFISSAAALAAARLCAGAEQWFLFSHNSAESGHRHILAALDARPLLDLGMRLGEGTGAAVAVPLLRMACDLHNRMATFDDTGVEDRR